MTLDEIKDLAKSRWEGCQGCDDNDKNFWMNGFITGYLHAQLDSISKSNSKTPDVLCNEETAKMLEKHPDAFEKV